MLNLGICGGHRTGKTTLAKRLATALGIPFVPTTTSQIFKEHGIDPTDQLNFDHRLFIQEKILTASVNLWLKSPQPFITDRTPLDMMAYTIVDIQGNTEADHYKLMTYYQACIAFTNQFFSNLAIVQPGIELINEAGKAALNPCYIEHLNILIQGLCANPAIKPKVFCLPRTKINLNHRVSALLAHWQNL